MTSSHNGTQNTLTSAHQADHYTYNNDDSPEVKRKKQDLRNADLKQICQKTSVVCIVPEK